MFLVFRKEELKKIFARFDQDGSQTISYEEARSALSDFGFSDSEVLDLMRKHDANQDGYLQYTEFVHFWNACGGKVPA